MGLFDFINKKPAKAEFLQIHPVGLPKTPQEQLSEAYEKVKMNEAKFGLRPEELLKIGKFRAQSVKRFTEGTYNLANQLVAKWTHAVTTRREYLLIARQIHRYYIVKALLDTIVMDVLNPDENGDIVKLVASEGNKELQAELDDLADNIDFNVLLEQITREFIALGEYSIRLECELDRGLVRYFDDVEPLNMLAFYEAGVPVNFMVFRDRDFQILPAHSYAHFILGDNKMRVRVSDQLEEEFGINLADVKIPKEVLEKLPDYVRIGEPMFLGLITKLRELQILESLVPSSKLNQLTQSQLVSLNVPPTMPPDKVKEALEDYEEMLNVPSGLDFSKGEVSLAEILTATGKMKLVPNYSDGKGSLSQLNIRDVHAIDDILNATKDIRAIIMTSIGFPPSLLFGNADNGGDKVNELRMFGRYARKLSNIQKAIRAGVRQIVMAHLINKGVDVRKKDFDVIFIQPLPDTSSLEMLELDDAKNEILDRTLDFSAKMIENPVIKARINPDGVADWVEGQFAAVANGHELFLEPKAQIAGKVRAVSDKIMDIVQAIKHPDHNKGQSNDKPIENDADASMTDGNS